ncbi:hypothetical protein ACIQTM_29485 [Streptomyces erythrochromogenes]|uniref:hypothetical protein n=1 Tax=Streptomyces erythrochromogenes TaxID=285574 RepID=UPI0038299267
MKPPRTTPRSCAARTAREPAEDGQEGPQVLPRPRGVEAGPGERAACEQQRAEAGAFDELHGDVVVFAVLELRDGSRVGARGGQQVQEHPLAAEAVHGVVPGLLQQHLAVVVRGVLGRVDAAVVGGADRVGHPEPAPEQAVARVLVGGLPVVERPGRPVGCGRPPAPEDVDGAGVVEGAVAQVQRPAVPVAHVRRDVRALHPVQEAGQAGQTAPEILDVVRVHGGEPAAAPHREDGGIEGDLEVGAASRQVPDHRGGDLAHLPVPRRDVDLPALLRRGRVVPVAPPEAAADEPRARLRVEPAEEVVVVRLVEGVERVKEQCVVPREERAVDPSSVAHLSCQPL